MPKYETFCHKIERLWKRMFLSVPTGWRNILMGCNFWRSNASHSILKNKNWCIFSSRWKRMHEFLWTKQYTATCPLQSTLSCFHLWPPRFRSGIHWKEGLHNFLGGINCEYKLLSSTKEFGPKCDPKWEDLGRNPGLTSTLRELQNWSFLVWLAINWPILELW